MERHAQRERAESQATDMVQKHVEVLKTNPRLDLERVRNVKYIKDFDRYVIGIQTEFAD